MKDGSKKIKKLALAAQRREQIMQAALDLFRIYGYHGTSMRRICDLSKVNRASIYDYFDSKADILIYIYKRMMFEEGNFYETYSDLTISNWNDLEPFIRSTISFSWTQHRYPIQLMYRTTLSLDSKQKKFVLRIESDYIKMVSRNLQKGIGFDAVTTDLEILANTIVYFNAFVPLRGWNMQEINQDSVLDSVVDMIMIKLKSMKQSSDVK